MLFSPANELARPFDSSWISHLDELPNPQVIHSDHLAIGQRNRGRPIIATTENEIYSRPAIDIIFSSSNIYSRIVRFISPSETGNDDEGIQP